MTGETLAEEAIWQELEFGSYRADLGLWEEIAAARGPVLELGAGAGRVALHLAGAGHEVIALERDRELAGELERRSEGMPVAIVRADLGDLGAETLPAAPRAAIAPLHVIQQLEPEGRRPLLAALAAALPAGGLLAAVVVDESSFVPADLEAKPLPDMRELEGWVFSSEPLWVQLHEREIRIRRLRARVSPDGRIDRRVHDDLLARLAPDALEAEGAEAGFNKVERRPLRTGTHEADSIAVVMERR